MERFLIDADHYSTEAIRKDFGYQATTGMAQTYLTPRYRSEDVSDDFHTAQEMLQLLSTHFLARFEKTGHKQRFHGLYMCEKGHTTEKISEFTSPFRSAATQGKVRKEEWFYQMWEKITLPLQNATVTLLHTWIEDFDEMVKNLTAIDLAKLHH